MKIYISPSSQWENKYSYSNYTEAQVCGMIAQATEKYGRLNGYECKVGSNKSTITERVVESNGWDADIHLAIHTNAGGGDGTLVLCYKTNVNNKCVVNVYKAVAELTPTKDDGIRTSSILKEINNTNALCVYLEVEFHDNKTTAQWIVNHVEEIGKAIVKGLCKADGKEFKDEKEQEKEKLYYVQCGAFSKLENAEALRGKLIKAGFNAIIK